MTADLSRHLRRLTRRPRHWVADRLPLLIVEAVIWGAGLAILALLLRLFY